jgi:hypothetical protein
MKKDLLAQVLISGGGEEGKVQKAFGKAQAKFGDVKQDMKKGA